MYTVVPLLLLLLAGTEEAPQLSPPPTQEDGKSADAVWKDDIVVTANRHQETLHPGDYSVKVSYDKKSGREPKEIKATVKAAERTETNVPQ